MNLASSSLLKISVVLNIDFFSYLKYFHWTRGPANHHWAMGGDNFHTHKGCWNSAIDTRRKRKRATRLFFGCCAREYPHAMRRGQKKGQGRNFKHTHNSIIFSPPPPIKDISFEFCVSAKLTDYRVANYRRRRVVFHCLLDIQSRTRFL